MGTPFLVSSVTSSYFTSTAIAVDTDGRVHITYPNSFIFTPAIDAGLLDRVFRGVADGGFDTEVAVDVALGGGLADRTKLVAGGGMLHAALRTSQTDNFRLLYARRTDAGWQAPEEVNAGARIGNYAYDLAVAPDGTVHVAFQVTNAVLDAGVSTAAVAHAQRTGAGQWTVTQLGISTQPVSTNRTLGRALSMVLLPSGEPAIAYEGDTEVAPDGGLTAGYVLATRSGGLSGTFSTQPLVASFARQTAVTPISLGVAGDGALYFAYRLGGGSMGSIDNGLRTRYRAAGSSTWVDGPVPSASWTPTEAQYLYSAANPVMQTAPDGKVWFMHDGPSTLYRLDGTRVQRFSPPIPAPGAFGTSWGGFPAFAIGADGKLHLAVRWRDGNLLETRLYYVRYE